MRRLFAALLVVVMVGLAVSLPAHAATSVKIQPLLYRDSLGKGEKKSGFVDVSNPNDIPTTYRFSVQAFRQINDEGTLQFYNDEQITSGLRLDVDEVELQPKDMLRLHFTLDGAKLPQGSVFAAIMATSMPTLGNGTAVSVRAGTLFALENGTPPSHTAEVTDLSVPILQIGDAIHATARITNTAPAGQMTGFFPTISVTAWPYIHKDVAGPLVFAGRTRTVTLVYPGSYAGVLWLKVGAGMNDRTVPTIVVTGWYRWGLPLILGVVGILMYILLRYRSGRYRERRVKTFRLGLH